MLGNIITTLVYRPYYNYYDDIPYFVSKQIPNEIIKYNYGIEGFDDNKNIKILLIIIIIFFIIYIYNGISK